jgi:shikimate dehydrogenase
MNPSAVPYASQACAARGLKVVDGAAMIRHQLPLQTAFWRGDT